MIRIGVLGTASIADRRMIPAMLKHPGIEYAGVAIATKEETGTDLSEEVFSPAWQRKKEKAETFARKFGGETVESYEEMLQRTDVDAVYIPLPPALHYRWILAALRYGKHVLAEKPLTVCDEQSQVVIREAEAKELAVIENYGFCFHRQMKLIQETVQSGSIGELRLIRASFCFPHRDESDFRYNKALGGGALLDCGGYTVKAASCFLGERAKIVSANLVTTPGHEVDVYGSATMRDEKGLCAQLSFGMDNAYVCELEIRGSTGSVTATRAYTAPDGFGAPVLIRRGNETEERQEADDQFEGILEEFLGCIRNDTRRQQEYGEIRKQSAQVEELKRMAAGES